jgi:hypothetical protein
MTNAPLPENSRKNDQRKPARIVLDKARLLRIAGGRAGANQRMIGEDSKPLDG